MGKFFVNQGGADIDSLDKELLKKLEEVAKRAGLKKLPLTSGKRTEKSTIRLMEDFISRGFPIRGWDSKKNKMTDEIIRSKTKPLTDFKKYPKAYSILKKGVIRDGTYKNRGEVNKAIDKLDLDDSIKKEMKDSLKAVRQNFGGLESGHLKGIKADTSLAAFKRTFGEREGADKFRVFREELEKSDLNPYFEKDNNNVLDISLYGKKSKPKKTIEDYKKEGYKPFPSELLKKDNLVMADKKGDSFFKKLVQQEAQKEIKEKKKSYDDMNFSDAFEEAMKDKGEGGVFKYKGKDILLKRAKPKIEESKPVDFQSLIKEYASKEVEPVEDVTEDMDDFQRTELMDRESELERLLKKRSAFSEGGRKYEDGSEFVDNMMLDAIVPEEEPSNYVEDPTREDPINDVDLDSMKFDMDNMDVKTDSITEPKLESVPEVKLSTIKEPKKANTLETIKENVLPEEPVKEDKPLTMDTLEQRFKDLMQASKEERKTAAWATAASQIASMIDRASANPIGIKPINFQANQASSEAKDLLALGKLKGLGVSGRTNNWKLTTIEDEQGRPVTYRINPNTGEKEKVGVRGYSNTLVKDPKTGLLIDKRSILRSEDKKDKVEEEAKTFYQKLTPIERSDFKEIRSSFEKETVKTRDGLDKINGLIKKIKNATTNEIAASQLGAEVANLFENGRLTDEDVKRYTKRNGLPSVTKDYFVNLFSGTITEDKANEIKETLKIFNEANKLALQERLLEKSSNFATDHGMEVQDVAKNMYPSYFKKSENLREGGENKPKINSKTYTEEMLKNAADKSFGGDLEKARTYYESKGYSKR